MNKRRVILIIQARMGSSRLPGKSIMDLAGKTLLVRILDRVKKCLSFQEIVLAIPDRKEDDILQHIGENHDVKVFRGSELNLLERYYKAALQYKADIVARLPADNPLPEPSEIDKLVSHHLDLGREGFSSNLSPFFNSGYPDGIGIEVFNFSLLKDAYLKNNDPIKNEHVHLNFFNYKTERPVDNSWCPVSTIKCPKTFSRPDLVLDVNTQKDYKFIKEIYEYFAPEGLFHITDVLDWYENVYQKDII